MPIRAADSTHLSYAFSLFITEESCESGVLANVLTTGSPFPPSKYTYLHKHTQVVIILQHKGYVAQNLLLLG